MIQSHPRILVVGAGIIGLTCALRLADAGAHVQLFEARAPGQGATRAALGALWPASPLANGPLQQLHRASLWQFEAFAAELIKRSGLPVSFHRLGRLELLNSEKAALRAAEESQAACAAWPSFGGDPVMELLTPSQIAVRWPHLAPAAYAGLLCRATAQVHVPELVTALHAACTKAGVLIHTQTRITALPAIGGHITGAQTADRLVEADAVLVTTGAWTPLLSPEVAILAPIRPAKGQGLALQFPHALRLETIVKSDSIYLIPWYADGEILVGSTTEPEAGFDEMPTAPAREALRAGAAAIMPGLKDAVVLRHWAGLRPQNPAQRHPPIMGADPQTPNLFLCTGHFKTGIGLAPLVARLVAESMLAGTLAPALVPFAPR